MCYNAIIVEDDVTSQEHLASSINNHFPQIRLVAICETLELARQSLQDYEIHLIFLDVHLRDESGFDLLPIHVNSQSVHLIFVTGYDRYAIEAIRYQALDYLLKPIDIEELTKAIQRFLNKMSTKGPLQHPYPKTMLHTLKQVHAGKAPTHLTLYDHEGFHLVKFEEIIYLKGENNYTHFYLAGDEHKLISKTLKEYELLLEPIGFVRVHKSFIINPKWVKSYLYNVCGQVEMKSGVKLDVSRRRSQLLFEAIDRLSIGTKAKTKFRT